MPASVIVLIAMTVVVAILAVYRRMVASNEDDTVHLAPGAEQLIEEQKKTAQSLRLVDRAGITLTVATAIYGVGLFANYIYIGLTQQQGM